MFLRGKVSGPLSPASLRANTGMGEGGRGRERGQTQEMSVRWVPGRWTDQLWVRTRAQQTNGGPRLKTTQNGVSRKGVVLSVRSRTWFLDSSFQLRRPRSLSPPSAPLLDRYNSAGAWTLGLTRAFHISGWNPNAFLQSNQGGLAYQTSSFR